MQAREELRDNSKDHVNRNRNQNVLDCFNKAMRKEQGQFYLIDETWLRNPQHSRTFVILNQNCNRHKYIPLRSLKIALNMT